MSMCGFPQIRSRLVALPRQRCHATWRSGRAVILTWRGSGGVGVVRCGQEGSGGASVAWGCGRAMVVRAFEAHLVRSASSLAAPRRRRKRNASLCTRRPVGRRCVPDQLHRERLTWAARLGSWPGRSPIRCWGRWTLLTHGRGRRVVGSRSCCSVLSSPLLALHDRLWLFWTWKRRFRACPTGTCYMRRQAL